MIRIVGVAVLLTAAVGVFLQLSRYRTDDANAADRRAYWVVFDSIAARSDRPAVLSRAALERRERLGIGIFPNDRPLPDSLLELVTAYGGRIRSVSRWLRAVSIDAEAAVVARLATHTAVREVSPVRRLGPASADSMRGAGGRSHVFQQTFDSTFYGANWNALRELGVPDAHRLGFTGRGVRIAILDTGFETGHESLSGRRVIRARDFIEGDNDVVGLPGTAQSLHGTQVWSLMGGRQPGLVVGPAYDAHFILARVDAEPFDTEADEDRWVEGIEFAEQTGARIVHSSVTFRTDFSDRPSIPYAQLDGNTTKTTIAAAEAVRRGVIVVAAMGNGGPATGSLHAPADADSVISIGAVDALGAPASFAGGSSGRGPAFDGTRKPELSARGIGLTGAGLPGPASYQSGLAGTSYSAALITGAIAQFLQAWPQMDAMAVRRALVMAGRRASSPNNQVGAGVPDVAAAIMFPQGILNSTVESIDQEGRFTTIVPTFSWEAPQVHGRFRPIRYRVEIATDPVFDNVIHADTVTEASALRLRAPLRPAEPLWWRVVAFGGGSFAVRRASAGSEPVRMPRWVRLASPLPTRVTHVDSAQPTLAWTPLASPAPHGPFTYEVHVLSHETGQLVQPAITDLETSVVRVPFPLQANVAYRWRVIARLAGGAADTVESASPFVVTSVERPPTTLLYQNFPNPFPGPENRVTRIWFDLAEQAVVELAIFDMRARLVRRLIPATASCGRVTLDAGQYGRNVLGANPDPCVQTIWDGADQDGSRVPRGVYILRLRAGGREEYRRMVFLGGG